MPTASRVKEELMKKILLAFLSFLLLAGVVQAAEMTQAINAEYTAQNTGRSRATDSSVVLKVWGTEGILSFPGLGVSTSTTIIVYTNYATGAGVSIDTQDASFDTVGEVVDYINTNLASDSTIKMNASVGTDAYRDMPTTSILRANIVAVGTSRDTAGTVATANSRIMSAGVESNAGVTPRIKSISCQMPVSVGSGATGVTLSVYDGNTRIWRKYTGLSGLYTAGDVSNSANSVVFPGKGLAATKGNSICAVATSDGNVLADTSSLAINNIAIIYDKLRD